MTRLRPYAAEMQHTVLFGSAPGPKVPLVTMLIALVAVGVGVGTHLVPEASTPVGLALATFITLDRLTRQGR
ncbi:hypothetical protein GA0070615_6385 [Micromonospora aurantiaca]|nr:hypothetical protein GA0070615_6385 [Micromonospora aurantiaca]